MDTLSRRQSWFHYFDRPIIYTLAFVMVVISLVAYGLEVRAKEQATRHTVIQYSATGETLGRWEKAYVRYGNSSRCNFRTTNGQIITITNPYMLIQEASIKAP